MWLQVDTIYNLIMDVILFHILHIKDGDICETEHEIVTKYISAKYTVTA